MLYDYLKRPAVWLLLLSVNLFTIPGCDALAKKPASLAAVWSFQREDNWISDDRYRIVLTVYHTEPQSISGHYIVRAYGDVFGVGGQDNGTTDNYDESPEMTMEPGEGGGFSCFYYINDPDLRKNNISVETVKMVTDMRFKINFVPSASESRVTATESTIAVSDGEGKFVYEKR